MTSTHLNEHFAHMSWARLLNLYLRYLLFNFLDIVEAAKNVASTLGGDKQIESELLSKLLGSPISKEVDKQSEKKPLNLRYKIRHY